MFKVKNENDTLNVGTELTLEFYDEEYGLYNVRDDYGFRWAFTKIELDNMCN